MDEGVDLYERYNPVYDWEKLGEAISFAWVKGTDGVGRASWPADTYVRKLRAVGVPWGLYHFAEPGDPVAQAHAYLTELVRLGWQPDAQHLVPALDMESAGMPVALRGPFAWSWLETVHAELGNREALYASTSWLRTLNPDARPYDWDLTWAAEYSINDGQPHAIHGYAGRVDVHQYTSKGSVAGITGWVDRNRTANVQLLLANGSKSVSADVQVDKVQAITQAQIGRPNLEASYLWTDTYGFANKAFTGTEAIKALLATVIANQHDDLSEEAVLAHLDGSLVAAVQAVVAHDVVPALAELKSLIASGASTDAAALLDALAERLSAHTP